VDNSTGEKWGGVHKGPLQKGSYPNTRKRTGKRLGGRGKGKKTQKETAMGGGGGDFGIKKRSKPCGPQTDMV